MDRLWVNNIAFYIVLGIIVLLLNGCVNVQEYLRENDPDYGKQPPTTSSTTCAAGTCYTTDTKGVVVHRTTILKPLNYKRYPK